MGTLSRLFWTLSLRRVGRELCASADRIRVAGIDNYFVCLRSSLEIVSTAILRACTGFYSWARSGWFIRLLARVADRTSHGVSDNDNLRRISSAEAATFTIRRVLADFCALRCSGWPTPTPLPEWHVPGMGRRFQVNAPVISAADRRCLRIRAKAESIARNCL